LLNTSATRTVAEQPLFKTLRCSASRLVWFFNPDLAIQRLVASCGEGLTFDERNVFGRGIFLA
jgi:hypothetical protein